MPERFENKKPRFDPAWEPKADTIRVQLQKMLESPEFHATESQREFLRFVVLETLGGRSGEIKGYTVATSVFGRRKDFDANLDPIVSIQANKLRRAMERYYLVAGQRDPVRIEIPKGTYVPSFTKPLNEEPISQSLAKADERIEKQVWPVVLVRLFQNETGDPEANFMAVGIANELSLELSRYRDIRVLLEHRSVRNRGVSEDCARFEVSGSIRKEACGVKLFVRLKDMKNGFQLWGDSLKSELEPSIFIAFEEEVARSVAAKIACERGIISRKMSVESLNKPPNSMTAYEALLQYYEWDKGHAPNSLSRTLAALEHAVQCEPECGLVWSMLGRLHALLYSFGEPGFENNLDKAISFAAKGVQLNPGNQRSLGILAFVRLLSGEIEACLSEIEYALSLNPHTLLILDGLGYMMTLAGQWERGTKIINYVMSVNPYYNNVVHYALWLDHIRRGNFEKSYLEALKINAPEFFWDHLANAISLSLVGKYGKARKSIERLLTLKSDFPEHGRKLIGHFVKFDDLSRRMIEGLGNAGLHLE